MTDKAPQHAPTSTECADCPSDFAVEKVKVRLATVDDASALRGLFQEGVVDGYVRQNDTGADIENIIEGYFSDEGQSGFWVAIFNKSVIGMIGVQKTKSDTAEIRRLRVRNAFRRRGVGAKLMEQALSFCQHQGYLKVVLDVRIERGPAIALFEKFGFTHARSREVDGRKLLDFYIDLYRDPKTGA